MLRRLSPMFLALLLVACGGQPAVPAASDPTAAPAAPAATEAAAAATNSAPRKVTLAMAYIPNVQFAPYYVAQAKGYYAEEGLEVSFDYNFETDVVQRVAAGNVEFGMASGNSVLLARGQELPVKMLLTLSQRFPVVLFSKQGLNITKPEDLRGKSVGIPGRFGAAYVGLQALLYASGMQESDLDLQEIGFTQIAAVSEDKVQVATGYAMNEPIVLDQQGTPVNVIAIADYFPLASDGVIVGEELLANEPAVAEGFARATLKGLRDTLADPDAAFETSLTFIPEAQGSDLGFQRKVLQESVPYWSSEQTERYGLGYSDPEVWKETYTFLRESKLLASEVRVEEAFTNQFVSPTP
jgi:NitT/TauT family transport system substrate-binding protein